MGSWSSQQNEGGTKQKLFYQWRVDIVALLARLPCYVRVLFQIMAKKGRPFIFVIVTSAMNERELI